MPGRSSQRGCPLNPPNTLEDVRIPIELVIPVDSTVFSAHLVVRAEEEGSAVRSGVVAELVVRDAEKKAR